jgi:hypothetical protein
MAADRRVAVVGALLLLAACDAPSTRPAAAAYDPTVSTGGLVYHWTPGRTIAIYVDETAQPAGFDLVATVRRATALWSDVALFGEYAFRLTSDPRDADVVVHYEDAPRIVDVMDCEPPGSGDALTVFCADQPEAAVLPLLEGGGGRVKVDVYVDPLGVEQAILDLAGMTAQEYLVVLTAHELGHVLGIGAHSPVEDDIMRGVPLVRAPSAADAATLRWVIGQDADIRL